MTWRTSRASKAQRLILFGSTSSASGSEAGGGPDAPVLDLDAASDLGASDTDNISNDATPSFTIDFTGETNPIQAGDTFTFQDNAATLYSEVLTQNEIDTGVVNMGLAALSDGVHVFRARAERGGTPGDWSAELTYTLNRSLAAPALALDSGSDTGTLGDNITSDVTITLAVTFVDTKPSANDVLVLWRKTGAGAYSQLTTKVLGAGDLTTTTIADGTTLVAGNTYTYKAYLYRPAASVLSDFSSERAIQIIAPEVWTPAVWGTDLKLWIDASATANLKQQIDGTTNVTAANDPVGYLADLSGGGYHLAASANNTVRGTFQTTDYNHVSCDGTNDLYFRTAALGAYANGSATFGFAIRPNNPSTGRDLFSEESSSSGNPFYRLAQTGAADDDDLVGVMRNDAGQIPANMNNYLWGDEVVLNTNDMVIVIVDIGTAVSWYIDGVLDETRSYTRPSNPVTLNQFSLMGRRPGGTSAGWFAGRLSGAVAAIGDKSSDVANLTTYLAALQGRTL